MVNKISEEDYSRMWSEAKAYNEELAKKALNFDLSDEEREEYNKILNVSGTGIIGYIEIENIGVNLPIYHGTEETVSGDRHESHSSHAAGRYRHAAGERL